MPDIIDTESTLSTGGEEVTEKEFALDIQGLSKTYTKTVSGSDAKTNWKKMLGILTAKRKNQAKESLEEFHALRDVSFNLRKGESLGIIGLNGSGKSTLLQIIAGTLEPTSGTVKTNGRIAALLELGSGFNPDFTGKENIYLNATILGLSQSEIDAKYDDIVAFADIGDFIHQPVRTYSSGMSLRVAFAVIAHIEPEILIIDEALAVGDAKFIQKCMRFIRDFQKKGALVLVSHDIGAIQSLCNHCIWLHEAKIRKNGSPKEVTEGYLDLILGSGTNNKSETIQSELPEIPSKPQSYASTNPPSSSKAREVFRFNPDASGFGAGNAKIINVELLDSMTDHVVSYLDGQREVTIKIEVKAEHDLTEAIIGFIVRDRLGQSLFSDNTFRAYRENPVHVLKGQSLMAEFSFLMPILPRGDYSMTVAIAEGNDKSNSQHHWIHDAMIIRSENDTPTGLVGVNMEKTFLRALNNEIS
jgi:lipopolysaccharide transport system ATP-binding protein